MKIIKPEPVVYPTPPARLGLGTVIQLSSSFFCGPYILARILDPNGKWIGVLISADSGSLYSSTKTVPISVMDSITILVADALKAWGPFTVYGNAECVLAQPTFEVK